jgi:superfamily II DNA or RNA helicase
MKQNLKLIDNSTSAFQLGETVKSLLMDASYSEVSIATGYWDLPAMSAIYEALQSFLSREGTKLRILLGEEPSVKAYQVKNPEKQNPNFPEKYLKRDLEELALKEEYQKVADLLSAGLSGEEKAKIEVKVYRKNFLHAKCYIFGSDSENAVGIIGSSNFTKQGLFGNLELNQFEDNNATVNFLRKNPAQFPSHRSWFEDLWAESEAWARTFKEELLDLSKHGGTCYSPYEMYIHALYRIYGRDLQDENENLIQVDASGDGKPQLLKFQVQNANSLIKKLERQGVAMLSDSVGLGKTYTAIKVIEYFFKTRSQRVVIVCPAGLISQWERAFADFKIENPPRIYSLQDINKVNQIREDLKDIPVGLFVFDESHNLRSSGGSRFEAFVKWRQENEQARTLLLTATPINNQLSDLTNQIELGLGGNIYKLGRFWDRSRGGYFTLKERLDLLHSEMRRQVRDVGVVDYHQLKEQLTPLLNRFIVRRTRQGIEREYPDGLEINGKLQKFPKSTPYNLEYEVSNQEKTKLLNMAKSFPLLSEAYEFEITSLTNLEFLRHPLDLFDIYERRSRPIASSLEVVYTGILSLGFPCYRYNIYRLAYFGRQRGQLELNADDNRELSRQIGIYGIFRTIFLKRLESSLHSIDLSVKRYESKLKNFQEKLETFGKIVSVKNLSLLNKAIDLYNEESSEESDLDFDIDSFESGNEAFESTDADEGVFNVGQLKLDIEKDLAVVAVLKEQIALLVKKDNKIKVLADKLDDNEDQKVLIFTYFADTLEYLKKELPALLRRNKNVEFALGGKQDIENYAKRFAPIAKKYRLKPGEKEINYLVATDRLSEGQNLQDCGILINYDLHWNPVRMIQRNGRINRLGTVHEEIHIFNFRPTEQLESYLQLVRKLEDKINLIRYTVGSDQSILDEEPIPQDFTEDLYSRDEAKRLAAFQRIHETSELLAAEDLFLDDLRAFDRNPEIGDDYKQKLKNLPKGKWGKVQKRLEEEDWTHLAHLIDNDGEAGYFVAFDRKRRGELLSTTEGLLAIQADSDQNARFRDKFAQKPEIEESIKEFIDAYQFTEEDHQVRYNQPQMAAIAYVLNKMMEYGYPVREIELVNSSVLHSKNAYINRENLKLIRLVNRLNRRNQHVGDEVLKRLVSLAYQYKPDEKQEKAPLSEIIQIFA